MSIIVALISKNNGVVVSDGRQFGPAKIENGQIKSPAIISTEHFDKTFFVDNNRIIGAFAGLMSFSGLTVAKHISEIISEMPTSYASLDSVVKTVREGMLTRLQEVGTQEILMEHRKLDILLVSGERLTRANLRIVSIHFYSDNNDKILECTEIVDPKGSNRYCVRGDERACAAAERTLRANHAPNRDAAFLKKLAISAVEAGIKNADKHPYGSERACGGEIFLKTY